MRKEERRGVEKRDIGFGFRARAFPHFDLNYISKGRLLSLRSRSNMVYLYRKRRELTSCLLG